MGPGRFKIVAPFVGAWIEIIMLIPPHTAGNVAPFVGAWIEITSLLQSHLRLHVALLVEEGNVM